MKDENINDLPHTIRKILPEEVQEIYLEAYNQSWDSYSEDAEPGEQNRESIAHRDGWTAVQQEFTHNEKKGIWYRKGEEPDEAEEEQGLWEKLKDTLL